MVGLIASPWPIVIGYAVAAGLYVLILRDIAEEVRGQ
jgi:hypothetical protein